MQLNKYFELSTVDRKQFAENLGVHLDTVYKWERGERLPRREMLRQIFDITGGAVTANDFVGIRETG